MWVKLFNKWILWRLKKKAEKEYLPKKERKHLKKRYLNMRKELVKVVPYEEMVSEFIALLALEREPASPESIFNIGLACFMEAKDLEESYQTLADNIEKHREKIRYDNGRQAIFRAVSFYSEKITTQKLFFDEFVNVYLKLTGAAQANEYNFFRLGYDSSILYSLLF